VSIRKTYAATEGLQFHTCPNCEAQLTEPFGEPYWQAIAAEAERRAEALAKELADALDARRQHDEAKR
jgi:hypothetical protein